MSTIAVFLLLGGGAAFAASKLAKNSVGTKQIKNGSVTGIKIKKGTMTGTNINLAKLGSAFSYQCVHREQRHNRHHGKRPHAA